MALQHNEVSSTSHMVCQLVDFIYCYYTQCIKSSITKNNGCNTCKRAARTDLSRDRSTCSVCRCVTMCCRTHLRWISHPYHLCVNSTTISQEKQRTYLQISCNLYVEKKPAAQRWHAWNKRQSSNEKHAVLKRFLNFSGCIIYQTLPVWCHDTNWYMLPLRPHLLQDCGFANPILKLNRYYSYLRIQQSIFV